MHWVDRGPEPEGLVEIRVSHTPRGFDTTLKVSAIGRRTHTGGASTMIWNVFLRAYVPIVRRPLKGR